MQAGFISISSFGGKLQGSITNCIFEDSFVHEDGGVISFFTENSLLQFQFSNLSISNIFMLTKSSAVVNFNYDVADLSKNISF